MYVYISKRVSVEDMLIILGGFGSSGFTFLDFIGNVIGVGAPEKGLFFIFMMSLHGENIKKSADDDDDIYC